MLIYSGVSGIGKTSLLVKFQDIIKFENKNLPIEKQLLFYYYTFQGEGNGKTDMFRALKLLAENLNKNYKMDFPLFERGNIYLAEVEGNFVSDEQKKGCLTKNFKLS